MQVPVATFSLWITTIGFGVHHPNVYIVSNVLLEKGKILGNGRRLAGRQGDCVFVDAYGIARLDYTSGKLCTLGRSDSYVLFGISGGNGGTNPNGSNTVDKCCEVLGVGFPV